MECGGLIAMDVAEFEEACGESGCKLSAPVRDDVVRKAVVFEYVL